MAITGHSPRTFLQAKDAAAAGKTPNTGTPRRRMHGLGLTGRGQEREEDRPASPRPPPSCMWWDRGSTIKDDPPAKSGPGFPCRAIVVMATAWTRARHFFLPGQAMTATSLQCHSFHMLSVHRYDTCCYPSPLNFSRRRRAQRARPPDSRRLPRGADVSRSPYHCGHYAGPSACPLNNNKVEPVP